MEDRTRFHSLSKNLLCNIFLFHDQSFKLFLKTHLKNSAIVKVMLLSGTVQPKFKLSYKEREIFRIDCKISVLVNVLSSNNENLLILGGTNSGAIFLVNTLSGQLLWKVVDENPSEITSLCQLDYESFISCNYEGEINQLLFSDGRIAKRISPSSSFCVTICLSSELRVEKPRYLFALDKELKVYELFNDFKSYKITGKQKLVNGNSYYESLQPIFYQSKSNFAVAIIDKKCFLVNMTNRKLVSRYPEENQLNGVTSLGYFIDYSLGQHFLVASVGQIICMLNVNSSKVQAEIQTNFFITSLQLIDSQNLGKGYALCQDDNGNISIVNLYTYTAVYSLSITLIQSIVGGSHPYSLLILGLDFNKNCIMKQLLDFLN